MDDDFNTAEAISNIYEMIHLYYKTAKLSSENSFEDIKNYGLPLINLITKVFAILGIKLEGSKLTDAVEELKKQRDQARKNKDFTKADEIKKEIEKKGFIIKDTKDGTVLTWKARV